MSLLGFLPQVGRMGGKVQSNNTRSLLRIPSMFRGGSHRLVVLHTSGDGRRPADELPSPTCPPYNSSDIALNQSVVVEGSQLAFRANQTRRRRV